MVDVTIKKEIEDELYQFLQNEIKNEIIIENMNNEENCCGNNCGCCEPTSNYVNQEPDTKPKGTYEIHYIQKYVAGFMFSTGSIRKVWLITKNRPEWQQGRQNAIGGKIEENEIPLDTMIREFQEEAGLYIKEWNNFCKLTDHESFEVNFFYTFSDLNPITMTDEKIDCYEIDNLPENVIPNLRWLIPMALSFSKGEKSKKFLITEKL